MTDNSFDWVDEKEQELKEERAKGYFDIKEGKQQFVLLTHCAPLAQVFDPSTKKYRAAIEGDKNISMKGVCWVLQDSFVKQAKLPYLIVKAIRALQQNPDWEFSIPFLHTLTLDAEGAGTKEVKYSLTPSPKTIEISPSVMNELAKKPTPEQIVEKIKEGRPQQQTTEDTRSAPIYSYPDEGIKPDDIFS